MLRLLIDENFDHRILRGLVRRVPKLDVVIVRQIGLSGAEDHVLLRWAERETRSIVTHDIKTMVPYAKQLIARHEAIAGVIVVPDRLQIGAAINDLELLVRALSPADLRDCIRYLPL